MALSPRTHEIHTTRIIMCYYNNSTEKKAQYFESFQPLKRLWIKEYNANRNR